MSRVIQLISHNQHLFALTDAGEIFQLRKRRVKCRLEEYWNKLSSPFDDNNKTQESEPPKTFTKARPIPRPNTIDVMNPAPRRPTSIGSDGNYIPKRTDVVHAVKAVGWCVKRPALLLRGGYDYVGDLGFTYSDGSSGFVSSHYSSTESFSRIDIESKVELKNSGLDLQWLGVVDPTDERLRPFTNQDF